MPDIHVVPSQSCGTCGLPEWRKRGLMWVSKLKKWLLSKQSGSRRKGMFLQKTKRLIQFMSARKRGAFNLKKRVDLGVLLLFVFFSFFCIQHTLAFFALSPTHSLHMHTHKRTPIHDWAWTHTHTHTYTHVWEQKMGSIFWMYDMWVAQSICSLNRCVIKQRETLWFLKTHLELDWHEWSLILSHKKEQNES